MNNIRYLSRERQQRGETMRTIEAVSGQVRIVTTTPDAVRITEILTPEEALEWADELRDAAADAICRGRG